LPVLAFVIVAVAVALVYLNAIENPFHYDDFHSIVDNPHIKGLGNIARFFVDATLFSEDPRSSMYRPVLLTTYAVSQYLDPAIDPDPRVFRIINVVIHIAAVGIVIGLVSITCRHRWVGLGAGAIFAFHPVNSEVINYISSRSESLCALFFLASLTLYAIAMRAVRRQASLFSASVVAFAIALGAKSMAITLIPLLPLLEWSHISATTSRKWASRILRRNWPFWIIGGGYLIVVRDQVETALVGAPVRGMGDQVFTQLKAAIYYLKLLAMPTALNVEHQFWAETDGVSLASYAALVACASFAFASIRLFALPRIWSFWLAWPVFICSPFFVVPLHVLVNEHRLYLPAVAFGACISVLLVRFYSRNRRVAVVASGCLLIVYSLLVIDRNVVWRDSASLWADSLQKSPFMPRPHIFVGDSHKEKGQHERALMEYRTAIEVNPPMLSNLDKVVIYNNMGATFLAMGHFGDAIEHYQKALDLDPTYEKAQLSLEGLLAVNADLRDARAEEHHEAGLKFLVLGEIPKAIASFKSALEIQSSPETWLSLGICYERLQKWEEAVGAYSALAVAGKNKRGYVETAAKKLSEIRTKMRKSNKIEGS
jgi:tetratricopeptide (TPR) repeat protein